MMIILLVIIGAALSLYYPKSNRVTVYWLIVLWICSAFTYGNADESIYISQYENPELWASNMEILYRAIMKLARTFGMSFTSYKVVITAIEMMLVTSTVKKYARYPNLVFTLYFWFPFMLNVAQMRNALASAVLIFGIRYLIDEKESRKNNIKFIITVILATLIHTSFAMYIILIFAKKMSAKRCWVFVGAFSVVIFVFSPSNLSSILSRIGVSNRILSYLSSEYQTSSWRHYGMLAIVLLTFAVSMFVYRYMIRNVNLSASIMSVELYKKINIILLCVVPIIIQYTAEIYRVQTNLTIINYMMILNSIGENRKHIDGRITLNRKEIQMGVVLLMYVIVVFYLVECRYGMFENIVEPIFKNNVFSLMFK